MFHFQSPKHPSDLRGSLTLQRPCHAPARPWIAGLAMLVACVVPASAAPPAHDYPTQARVEFVNDCIARNGGQLSRLYQCSCVIDDIANRLTYEDFVEDSTFARYSSLPGEGGAIFRDSDQAKARAKQYREIEKNAYRACGLG